MVVSSVEKKGVEAAFQFSQSLRVLRVGHLNVPMASSWCMEGEEKEGESVREGREGRGGKGRRKNGRGEEERENKKWELGDLQVVLARMRVDPLAEDGGWVMLQASDEDTAASQKICQHGTWVRTRWEVLHLKPEASMGPSRCRQWGNFLLTLYKGWCSYHTHTCTHTLSWNGC